MTPERLDALITQLPSAKHLLECYAQFIREFVSHRDLDKHPYLPDIDDAAELITDTLAALRAYREVMAQVAELRCPAAYGFEGLATYPDCGVCVVCRARAMAPTEAQETRSAGSDGEPRVCSCPHCKSPKGSGLLFQHWSKDPAVPYYHCQCATCLPLPPRK